MSGQLLPVIATRATLARVRNGTGKTLGLVPTMGALHAGHESLIRRAAAENDRVVVSVFVNPTQFTDPDDLARYPRPLERDIERAAAAGATAIYAPPVEEMYPQGFATRVQVEVLTDRWEGEARPGHFDGVATVVTLLLNQVGADRAYFGEKDFQQLTMIRRLHADLALPGEIVACPVVRDDDGVALSSRNARLTPADRKAARALHRALIGMRDMALAGEVSALKLALMGAIIVRGEPAVALDYLQVVDPLTLDPLDDLRPGAQAIIAATVGGVRLIDTMAITPGAVAP